MTASPTSRSRIRRTPSTPDLRPSSPDPRLLGSDARAARRRHSGGSLRRVYARPRFRRIAVPRRLRRRRRRDLLLRLLYGQSGGLAYRIGRIYDPLTGTMLWSSPSAFQTAQASRTVTALGDADGDGRLDVAMSWVARQNCGGGIFQPSGVAANTFCQVQSVPPNTALTDLRAPRPSRVSPAYRRGRLTSSVT